MYAEQLIYSALQRDFLIIIISTSTSTSTSTSSTITTTTITTTTTTTTTPPPPPPPPPSASSASSYPLAFSVSTGASCQVFSRVLTVKNTQQVPSPYKHYCFKVCICIGTIHQNALPGCIYTTKCIFTTHPFLESSLWPPVSIRTKESLLLNLYIVSNPKAYRIKRLSQVRYHPSPTTVLARQLWYRGPKLWEGTESTDRDDR